MYIMGLSPPNKPKPTRKELESYDIPSAKIAIMLYRFIKKLTDDGRISVAFRESSKNRKFKKHTLSEGTQVSPNSFSAVITKL